MKVVSLLGSPRKEGNSTVLAKIISDTLEQGGAEVITYSLNKLDAKGCQACRACKTKSDTCILKDELAPVLKEIHDADIIILATPVYWGEVSAQMKLLIDRLYSFLTPDFMTAKIKHRLPAGKKLVFIQSQGSPVEDMYNEIFPRYNAFFSSLGFFEETYTIQGCGLNEPGDTNSHPDLTEKAKQAALTLLQS